MSTIKYGSSDIDNVMYESSQVSKLMFSGQTLWSSITPEWSGWSGLTSYYRMDETSDTSMADAVGSATGTKSAAFSDANGINNYCNLLNGTTDNIDLGTNFMFERTDSFSLSFWFKRTNLKAYGVLMGNMKGIAESGHGDYWGWYLLFTDTSNNNMILNLYSTSTSKLDQYGGHFPTTGIWYHLVVTYDGQSASDSVKMYQAGTGTTVTVSTSTLTTSIVPPSPSYMGYRNAISTSPDARLDEVGIWNRVLTATEASELYNAGAGIFY